MNGDLGLFLQAVAAAVVFGIFIGFCLSDFLFTRRSYRREGKRHVS